MDNRSYIKIVGNLNQYSGITGTTGTTYVAPLTPAKIEIIKIGAWNISTVRSKEVSIPSFIATNKFRDVKAVILSDGNEFFPLEWAFNNIMGRVSGRLCVTADRVVHLERSDEGLFADHSGFNDPYMNRGYVTFFYSGIQPPALSTGTVTNLLATSLSVSNSRVTDLCNAQTSEYGVVYSQNFSTPTVSNSTKVSTSGSIATNTPYTKNISGLNGGTNTYIRAYACNCEEVGYGNTCTQLMPAEPPQTGVELSVHQDLYQYANNAHGVLCIDPQMSTGQCVDFTLVYQQYAPNSGDQVELQVFCKSTATSGFWTDITNNVFSGNLPITDNSRLMGNGGGTVTLCRDDNSCICYFNNALFASSGSYSQFYISPPITPNPPSLNVTIDYNYYCDCVYN